MLAAEGESRTVERVRLKDSTWYLNLAMRAAAYFPQGESTPDKMWTLGIVVIATLVIGESPRTLRSTSRRSDGIGRGSDGCRDSFTSFTLFLNLL